jgi:hypothetical protein
MSTIEAHSKPIRDLLSPKYTIDYYQREYRWETRQIEELLDDLESSFLDSFEPAHERPMVADYSPYFLGSIVLNQKNGRTYIIDGQQRLTTLTLLLIYLKRLQPARTDFNGLVYSELFGKQSFNLDVPERTEVMNALVQRQDFDTTTAADRSVANIWDRFQDIVELFPESLANDALAHFTDWLLSRVILVEIVAFSDDDAYTIFETMNDRGLSLSATEMLKGYLLANVADDDARTAANERWRGRVNELVDFAKEDELDFFKAWLRAKYAETIRERKKGSTNQDFDKIGIGFHKWVRENHDALGLVKSSDYLGFVDHEFDSFSRNYLVARRASLAPEPGLESVHFNAVANFTLQYPLMLAPVARDDDAATARRKMGLVSAFIEIFIARRVVAYRTLGYSAIVYTMFNLMKDLRDRSSDDLAAHLRERVDGLDETFDAVADFAMHQQNQGSYSSYSPESPTTSRPRVGCRPPSHSTWTVPARPVTTLSTYGPMCTSGTRAYSLARQTSLGTGTDSAGCCFYQSPLIEASEPLTFRRSVPRTRSTISWRRPLIRPPTQPTRVSGPAPRYPLGTRAETGAGGPGTRGTAPRNVASTSYVRSTCQPPSPSQAWSDACTAGVGFLGTPAVVARPSG